MTPEQMAVTRREIELLPRGKEAIQHARAQGARLVAEGIAPCRIAGQMSALGLGIEITNETLMFFAETVRQSATLLRIQMQEAADMIAYDIAAYLDQRVPSAKIRAIANRVAGPLSADQVSAIVDRETAWWVRLHAQLEQAA